MSERRFGLGHGYCESKPGELGFSFSAYDMALLYNCKLFKSSINKLCNCSFDYVDVVKKVLKNYITDSSILDSIMFNWDDDFFQTCVRGSYFGYKDKDGNRNSEKIFFGFSPELLCRRIVYQKSAVENYLYGVAVKNDVVSSSLLQQDNVDYCEDDYGWIYFPMDNLSIESEDFLCSHYAHIYPLNCDDCSSKNEGYGPGGIGCGSDKSCVAASFDLERNLDICHSLLTLHKMEVLISVAGPKIVEKLNQENLGVEFVLGRSYNYVYPDSTKKIYCGDFIYMEGMAESIYFGLSPNVFDEEDEIRGEAGVLKSRNPQDIIISDYFSSVSMVLQDNLTDFGRGFDKGFDKGFDGHSVGGCDDGVDGYGVGGCANGFDDRCDDRCAKKAGCDEKAGCGEKSHNGEASEDDVRLSPSRNAHNIHNSHNTEKYINNGAEFAGNWVYFPVCRKLLCCSNFQELYINRIVKLVRESFIKYFG